MHNKESRNDEMLFFPSWIDSLRIYHDLSAGNFESEIRSLQLEALARSHESTQPPLRDHHHQSQSEWFGRWQAHWDLCSRAKISTDASLQRPKNPVRLSCYSSIIQ